MNISHTVQDNLVIHSPKETTKEVRQRMIQSYEEGEIKYTSGVDGWREMCGRERLDRDQRDHVWGGWREKELEYVFVESNLWDERETLDNGNSKESMRMTLGKTSCNRTYGI